MLRKNYFRLRIKYVLTLIIVNVLRSVIYENLNFNWIREKYILNNINSII